MVGAFALPTHAATTNVLYTTFDDFGGPGNFSGWSGNTAAATTAWDFDGSTVNGAANASPGATGTAGSLAITPSPGADMGWTYLCELYIGNFTTGREAIDPGYGPDFVTLSGQFQMVYTLPDNALAGAGTYYAPMLGFNAGWTWGLNGPDSTEYLGTVGGLETYRGTWSYSIPATPGDTYVNIMIGASTDYLPVEDFYVDQLVAIVPEPASVALLVMGAVTLLAVRRSRN